MRNITAQLTKFTKSSEGLTPIIIVAIVAVLLAVGGGAYFMMQKNGGENPLSNLTEGNPLSKVSFNPNCKYNDPELCKFLNNWNMKKDYKVTTTTKMGGITMESVYEMSGEDKFHMVSKQNGKEASNMISIGDTTYTLDYSDNKWLKFTYKPEENKLSDTSEIKEELDFKVDEAEDKTQYKFIAKEDCAGKTCLKYEITSPDMKDEKQYIWFDDSEYLMRKMLIETKEGNSESVFAYDSVSINVPSPVKEGPNAMPSSMSNPEVEKMMKEYEQQSQTQEKEMNDSPAGNTLYDMEQPLDDSSSEDYF